MIAVISLEVFFPLSQEQVLDSKFRSNDTTSEYLLGSDDSCPTWHLWNNKTKECTCQGLKKHVICNQANKTVSLAYGYCMTFDNETKETHVGKCYYTVFSRYNDSWYQVLPKDPIDLNEVMCSRWHREGYLCSQCRKGYGLSVANLYMRCVECTLSEGVAWLLFFMLQLIPVTVLFFIVIIFRLSITQPPMNVFVMYSQLSLVLVYQNAARFQTPFLSSSVSSIFVTIRSIYLPVLSLWNLSFGHISKLTDFCVHSRLVYQQSYLFTYITNIHVLLLVVMAYILIELHARNCRIVVWLWRPFSKCFIRCTRVWNPRLTTVDTFATFLLLSYNRFIILSYFIYAFQQVYSLNDPLDSRIVLSYNPMVSYFDRHHLPYILVSFVVLLTLVLTPAIILALYQTKFFKSCLECFGLNKFQSLRIFVELFQGCYKDGTSGTRDLRFTASLYLFLRLAILFSFTLCSYSDFLGCDAVTSLILLLATLLFIAVAQPYKEKSMNKVDIILFMMLILMLTLLSATSESSDTTVNAIVLSCVLFLVAIPQVIFYSLLVYKLSCSMSKLYCSQRMLKACHICHCYKQLGKEVELTNSTLLLELSSGRFDSSYQEESLLSTIDGSSTTNGPS